MGPCNASHMKVIIELSISINNYLAIAENVGKDKVLVEINFRHTDNRFNDLTALQSRHIHQILEYFYLERSVESWIEWRRG